jgi:hypothetical protein
MTPETGEVKQEDQGGGRQQRRPKERQGDVAEDFAAVGSQHPRRLLQVGIQVLQGVRQQTYNQGGIVEDVGDQDGHQRAGEADRRCPQAQPPHQRQVQPAPVAQERVEARRDDDRRQHKGNGQQGPPERFAGECVAGEEEGQRHPHHQCQQSGEGGLIDGEPQGAPDPSPRVCLEEQAPVQRIEQDARQRQDEETVRKRVAGSARSETASSPALRLGGGFAILPTAVISAPSPSRPESTSPGWPR